MKIKLLAFLLLIICASRITAQDKDIKYTPEGALNIQAFDVDKAGRRIVMSVFPLYEAVVVDIISGNEIMRLPGESFTPQGVYFDEVHDRIIVESFSKVFVWDASSYILLDSYYRPGGVAKDFNESLGQLAFLGSEGVTLLNVSTGDQTKHPIKGNFTFNSKIKFSTNGEFLFVLSEGKIVKYRTAGLEKVAKFEGEGFLDFVVDKKTVITRSSEDIGNGSQVQVQFHSLDGAIFSKPIQPKNVFQVFNARIQPFNGQMFYASYSTIDLIDSKGQEVKFSFESNVQDFQFAPNVGFTVNYGKRIDITDIEGRLINRIYGKSMYHSGGYLDKEGNNYCFVSENQLAIASINGEQAKPIQINSTFVNQFAGDKNLFAFPTRDNQIRVWDIKKKKQISVIPVKNEYPQFLQVSQENGIVVAAFATAKQIRVYDIASQQKIEQFDLKNDIPTSLCLKNDWLIAGSVKGNYWSWKIENGNISPNKSKEAAFVTPITSVEVIENTAYVASLGRMYEAALSINDKEIGDVIIGHESYIHDMTFDPEGKFLASASVDGEIKLWDYKQGQLLETVKVDSAWVNQMALGDSLLVTASGPGIVLAAFSNPALYNNLNNPNPELLIQSSNTSLVRQVVFSPDGKLLANTDGDRIKIREVQTGFMISELTTRDNAVNDITFDHHSKTLIAATGKGVEYFDPITGKSKKYINLQTRGRSIHQVEVFPKKNILVVVNHHAWHGPLFLHLNSGQFVGGLAYNLQKEYDRFILDIKISPDEKWLATYGSDFIKIFEPDKNFRFNQVLAIPRSNPGVRNDYWADLMDISEDGHYLSYVEFSKPNHVVVYDVLEKKEILREPGKLSEFGKDSNLLMMSSDETLELKDVISGKTRYFNSTKEHNTLIQALAYDPTFDLFASSDIWGNLKTWSAKDAKALQEVERFSNDIYTAEISPEGDFIAYNSKNGIFLFDLKQLAIIKLDGTNYPYFGEFSSDNKFFYFRKGSLYKSFDLLAYTEETLFDSKVAKDSAGGTKVSLDGKNLIFEDKGKKEFVIYDLSSNTKKTSFKKSEVGNYTVFSVGRFLSGSNTVFLGTGIRNEGDKTLSLRLAMYDIEKRKHKALTDKRVLSVADMNGWDGINMRYNMKINEVSPNGKYYAFLDDYHLKIQDLESNEVLYDKHSTELSSSVFTPDNKYFLVGYEGGKVKVLSNDDFKEVYNFIGAKGEISSMNVRGQFLLVLGADDKINVFDMSNDFKRIYSCTFVGDGEFVITNEEGYYYSSKGAVKQVAFKKGSEVYPFEQFDLFYNRPDLAVKNLVDLGITDQKLSESFKKAYIKRLKKTGFTESQVSGSFQLPIVEIEEKDLPVVTQADKIEFYVLAKDSLHQLDRINLWVNDVPVFGTKGQSVKGQSVRKIREKIELILNKGKNKVQVSVTNIKGAESLKKTFVIDCQKKESKPSLYLVSIGASKYSSSDFNLKYAAKDARDIIDYSIELKNKFEKVETISLLNEQVTKENIANIKEQLMQSKVSDIVIVFFAGHGLLDSELDYYFATYDVDFLDPAQRGLPYEDLEGILDGIPARKKLLLVDACHSGEIDKDEVMIASAAQTQKGEVSFRGFTNLYAKKGELGLKNSFELMQMLFADLRRGTGAMVISSASGVEFAQEGEEWSNGVFTYALLEGLKSGDCDIDGDGQMKISEIREFVIDKVSELTNGQQHPTSRKENLEFDFSIW